MTSETKMTDNHEMLQENSARFLFKIEWIVILREFWSRPNQNVL